MITKINLGCGNKPIQGFTNIDVRDLPGVDIIDNIKLLNSFEKNSIQLIYASHVLEHFGRHEYMEVLKRWHEVISPGGTLRLSVPDIAKIALHYNQNKDLKKLRGFLWGGQTYPQNYHYMGWDFETLSEDLLSVGFKSVKRYDWRDTEHSHIDDFSQAYLPHMDKENGMLMSLNVEAIK